MCARVPRLAAAVLVVTLLASCGDERTGSAFCARLGKETPAIGQPITTKTEATEMVSRYERLLDVSPLSIERDMTSVVEVLRLASRIDTNDPQEVQELADATYAANQAALNVRDWVKSTCAVDISTGMSIAPPRTAPPTTSTTTSTTASTTMVPSTPDTIPVAETVAPTTTG